MSTAFKWLFALIGLIVLALIFPFVRDVYDFAAGNGTGFFYAAGGNATNNSFAMFFPILGPLVLFVAIILYAVRKSNSKEGGE
jgi:hypothetical protein